MARTPKPIRKRRKRAAMEFDAWLERLVVLVYGTGAKARRVGTIKANPMREKQ